MDHSRSREVPPGSDEFSPPSNRQRDTRYYRRSPSPAGFRIRGAARSQPSDHSVAYNSSDPYEMRHDDHRARPFSRDDYDDYHQRRFHEDQYDDGHSYEDSYHSDDRFRHDTYHDSRYRHQRRMDEDAYRNFQRSHRSDRARNHYDSDHIYYEDSEDAQLHTEVETYRGDNDVGDAPMRLLLVRSLAPHTTEQTLADAFLNLSVKGDSAEDTAKINPKRVFLVRNRRSPQQSLGFGYVEYHTVDQAKAAKAAAKETEDFRIDNFQPKVDFPHVGVFPHATFGKPERNRRYLIRMAQTGFDHKYHDMRFFCSELVVTSESPDTATMQAAADTVPDPAKETKVPKKRKDREVEASKPAHWKKWEQSNAELRSEDSSSAQEPPTKKPATGVNAISAPEYSDEQTFAHVGEKLVACYLCNSSFSDRKGIMRHLELSDKHAANLKDEEKVREGCLRLKKKEVDPDSTIKLLAVSKDTSSGQSVPTEAESAPSYRDRAAERRQEESQTGVSAGISFSLKGKGDKAKNPPASATSTAPEQPSFSAAARNMMQKQGFVTGQGLGESGTGITGPIEQSLYTAGVGLGHEHSKKGDAVQEASKATRGGDYAEKAKEALYKMY